MKFITPDAADFNEVCRVLTIPAGYAAVVMGALFELTYGYRWEVGGDSIEDAIDKMSAMIDAAYESDCNAMTSTPRHDLKLWREGQVITGGAMQIVILATQILGGYFQQSGAAVNDELSFPVMLEEGTYDLTICYRKNAFGGIIRWYVDGVDSGQTVDTYASTATMNNETAKSVTVVGSGEHLINAKVSAKAAASGGYFAQVSYLKIDRTGD